LASPAASYQGLELIVDAHAALGEGPVWDDRAGRLYWIDLLGGIIHRTDPATGADETIAIGMAVGCLALRAGGGLVLGVADGFATVASSGIDFELILPVLASDAGTRMNDGKPDPAGRLWAGWMSWDATHGAGGLFRLDPDLSLTRVLDGLTIPNGLDWSSDGRTMYYIDSPTGRVDRFEFDMGTGTMSAARPFVTIPSDHGLPDGMTIDAEGHLWVALFDGWGVHRYAPDGTLEDRIEVPAQQVTSVAFGGSDLDELYITTGQEDFPAAGKPDQPHAGGLFRCRPGVSGRLPNRFGG
jgi:sugar lactone lactonase YvrE